MQNMGYSEATVKYTTVLPRDCVNELKRLAEMKVIPSVNQGIRQALEGFIAQNKQREYELAMQEAASDTAFLKRTLDTQKAFANSDAEGMDAW
jgi:metal-responsive CopG/Arc/MetJ family transcriptional regulator